MLGKSPPDLRVEDFFEDKLRRKRPTPQTSLLLALSFMNGPLDRLSLRLRGLRACPCCGEQQPRGDATVCRACEAPFVAPPPPAPEALLEADDAPVSAPRAEALVARQEITGDHGWVGAPLREPPPIADDARVPWTSLGRGRGALFLVASLGVGAFFLPWLSLRLPHETVLTGLAVATRTGIPWLGLVAWLVLVPLVLSRRTVRAMQAARGALAVVAVAPGFATGLLVMNLSRAAETRGLVGPLRPEWGVGAYATVLLSVVAVTVTLLLLGGWAPLWDTKAEARR